MRAISGDVNFGLHMADYLELTRIGTYGYLLLNAPTIREFLELAARYYPLIYQGGRLELSASGAVAHFRYTFVRPCHREPRHLNEWTIGYFAKFIRSRIDPSWTPRVPRSPTRCRTTSMNCVKHLATSWCSTRSVTGFDFDSALLEIPISATDPVLLRIISHHADDLIQELGKKHPFKAQVRLLIMEGLEHGQANAEIVAKKLNLSLSSFKRRMQEAKLDFRALRDGIIKDLSERALAETSLPLSDIARKMGYSELSAFTRAFTRTSGMAPLAYRRSAKHREASRPN